MHSEHHKEKSFILFQLDWLSFGIHTGLNILKNIWIHPFEFVIGYRWGLECFEEDKFNWTLWLGFISLEGKVILNSNTKEYHPLRSLCDRIQIWQIKRWIDKQEVKPLDGYTEFKNKIERLGR